MKKKILLFLLLILIPFVSARAVEVDYDVVDAYISANIDILGSMHVQEAYVVKGSLNGYKREVLISNSRLGSWNTGEKVNYEHSAFYNARGLSINKVYSFKVNKEEIGWDILSKTNNELTLVDYAYKGDSGKYTKEKQTNGYELRLYNPNSSGYMVYLFDYYIDQVVVTHKDVAELYWQFIPTDFDDIKEAHIQVTIPGTDTDKTFRMWAHGPLTGTIAGISNTTDSNGNKLYQGVLLDVKNIYKGEGTDVRITFNKNLVNSSILNYNDEEALDKIIEVETKRADEANHRREMSKLIRNIIVYASYTYVVGMIALWIYMYNKYDKEYKVDFDAKYYREFTGDYDVEVIDYLLTKNVSTNAMSASIMNMIYKKNIEPIENPEDKKNVSFKLKNRDNLNEAEEEIIKLLFDEIGSEGVVTTKEIENYSKKLSTAKTFMEYYDRWKSKVTKRGKSEAFYEDLAGRKGIAALYILLGVIIFIISIVTEVIVLPAFPLIILSIIAFAIYLGTFNKYTMKGREHSLKWKAFKNFLKDFGSFSDKELPEIKLWEKYLVYATIFGLAKEVQKTMKIKLTEMNYDTNYINNYWYFNNDMYIANSLSNAVSYAHSHSVSEIASSSSSSGGGFGGGFSSGGGFGGGGGSGGGF